MEISSTTGTGTITLGGAVTGYQAFSVIGNGNTTYYAIDNGAEWEVGIGTYTASGTTLSRDTVLESSNSGSLVNFGAGVKTVFCTYPAERSVDTDTAQSISNKTIENSSIGAITPSTGKFTTLDTTGQVNFNSSSATSVFLTRLNTNGQTSGYCEYAVTDGTRFAEMGLAVSTTSSYGAVNEVYFRGSGQTSATVISSASASTPQIKFITGASGSSTEQMRITNTASSVNYVQVTGGATTTPVAISAQGSDSNIRMNLFSKGTESVDILTSGGAVRQAKFTNTTSSVNWTQLTGSIAGNAVPFSVAGSDTNISMAFQPKGTGAIDLAAGSSGVNISNGGTVTALTRTAQGSGYTSFPSVAISAPTTAGGVQATASVTQMVQFGTSPTINSGGTGYTVGDVLTVVGGTPLSASATMTVTSVSAGVITGINYTNFAIYTALPANPFSVTGGTGTGATFSSTWAVQALSITNAGSGYIEQPTVTFSGGGGSGAAAFATVGSGTIVKSIGANMSFYVPAGETFRASSAFLTGTAANYIDASGRQAGLGPVLSTNGSDTNVRFNITSKGNEAIGFYTNLANQQQFAVSHTASAVNYVQVTGGSTGNSPIISAQGSDTNLGLQIQTKGTGSLLLQPAGVNTLRLDSASGRVNQFQMYTSGTGAGSASGNIVMLGGDTNIDMNLTTKGAGVVNLNTGNGTQFRVADTFAGGTATNYFQVQGRASFQPVMSVVGASTDIAMQFSTKGAGNFSVWTNGGAQQQFQVSHTASAVNYVQVTGAATGSFPIISAQGSDTNAGLNLYAKGSARINFFNNNGANRHVSIGGNGSAAVNYLDLNGNIASNAPSIAVAGTDTNIDLALTPKGTGKVVITNGLQGGTF